MFALYFDGISGILTTLIVLFLLIVIGVSFARRRRVAKWGRIILLLVLVGVAASALSAMRDAYMTQDALFAAQGAQSMVCMIAGALIFLTGLIALFVRKQPFRKAAFCVVSALILVQIAVVEGSRLVMFLGGSL